MTALIAPPKIQILVGSDNQDWSATYNDFRASDPDIDDSGNLKISAILKLSLIASPPESMNPRTAQGKARWHVGQQIIVNVLDSSGQWQRHPRGLLFIASAPVPPSIKNPFLELDLVCRLQQRTFPQPRGQGLLFQPSYPPTPTAPARPTNSFSRDDAISEALQKAGINSSFVGNVPKHPVQCSIRKDDQNAYVDLAGQIAWGGGCAIYQNNQGQIASVSLALAPAAPLLTLEAGDNEVEYDHVAGDTALQKVIYTAEQKVSWQVFAKGFGATKTDVGDGAIVDPSLLGVEIPIRQTTRNETISGTLKTHTETILAPRGVIAPQAFPKDTGLGLDSEKVESWFFDGPGKSLSLHRIVETGMFAKVCSSAWSKLSANDKQAFKEIPVETIQETYYTYNREVPSVVTTRRIEPLGAIVTDEKLDNPTDPTLSFFQQTSWSSPRTGEWMQTNYTLVSAIRVRSDLNFKGMTAGERIVVKSALVTDPSEGANGTEISNSGQNTPPAPERLSIEREEITLPLEGTATFIVASSEFEPKEDSFSLETAVASSAQLTELAQIKGAWSLGRAQGAIIEFPWHEVFLTNPQPLQTLAVIETEVLSTGWKKNLVLYQIDGMEFTHEPESAKIAANLIWIGTIEGQIVPHDQLAIAPTFTASAVAPPYTELRLDTNGTGSQGELLIIPAPKMVSTSYAGLGLGATTEHKTITPSIHESVAGLGLGATSSLLNPLVSVAGLGLGATTEHIEVIPAPYTISQSSVYAGEQGTYANMTDTDGSTGATTDLSLDPYIKATFPSPVTVTNVMVGGGITPGAGTVSSTLNQLELQYSTDDLNWTTIASIGDYNVADSGPNQFVDIPVSSITAQYWRLWQSGGYAATTEFQITHL